MSESEALLYDHAQDLELEIERPLPDWGGDEVFATVPRRRRPRLEPATWPAAGFDRPALMAVEPAPAAEPQPEGEPEPPAPAGESRPAQLSWERPRERRTVVITGRPFDQPRRRPARTVDERIAHRPDRVAAWAVALGFGMVLAAILTAPL